MDNKINKDSKTLEVLEEVTDLRSIWPNEALDFTPWLSKNENIEILSKTLDMEIEVEEKESSVGSFNVDIYGYDVNTGQKIIIENQLEDTDHDHLGKLITYASGKSANIIIWMVKRAREEHRAAIEWLNNHLDDVGIFLCEIKLYRIGISNPAVKFEVIEKPNDWARDMKNSDKLTEAQEFRLRFWNALNEYASKSKLFNENFNIRKATKDHWMGYSMGTSKLHINVLLLYKNNEIDVEINIPDDKNIYEQFYQKKDEIEKNTGLEFEWMELPDKKTSRIVYKKEVKKKLKDENNWQEQFELNLSRKYTLLLRVVKSIKNLILNLDLQLRNWNMLGL